MYGSINAAGLRALPTGGSPLPRRPWLRPGTPPGTVSRFYYVPLPSSRQCTNPPGGNRRWHDCRPHPACWPRRRGGTEAVLHMVDYAFHEDTWSADLETVLKRIHSQWTPQVRQRMNDLYGEALNAFLSYAGIEPHDTGLQGN
ncbi:hypothetical protein NKH18_27415 [Streptomyces sp. M10(2022)]